MMSALGCAHQLPRTGFPAIASARLGTARRADSSTMPFSFTKARACFGLTASILSTLSALLDCAKPCPANDIASGMNDAPVDRKPAQRGRRVGTDPCLRGNRRAAWFIRGHAEVHGR